MKYMFIDLFLKTNPLISSNTPIDLKISTQYEASQYVVRRPPTQLFYDLIETFSTIEVCIDLSQSSILYTGSLTLGNQETS